MNKLKLKMFAGAMVLLASAQVSAATVTVYGDDLKFTYDDSTLYGTANVIGNNIFFIPSTFEATSTNGGITSVSETLEITIEVITPGYQLETFALSEQGDYLLQGAGASASATGNFMVESDTSANSDSEALDAGPLTAQDAVTEWNIDAQIDLADTAGWGSDTAVTVTLQNDLMASTTTVGELAFVEKKIGAVGVLVNPIPVPAAVWLFASGLGLLGFVRRRKAL